MDRTASCSRALQRTAGPVGRELPGGTLVLPITTWEAPKEAELVWGK